MNTTLTAARRVFAPAMRTYARRRIHEKASSAVQTSRCRAERAKRVEPLRPFDPAARRFVTEGFSRGLVEV
eukprot:1166168-Prorocentrum_minimum.AAC.1